MEVHLGARKKSGCRKKCSGFVGKVGRHIVETDGSRRSHKSDGKRLGKSDEWVVWKGKGRNMYLAGWK